MKRQCALPVSTAVGLLVVAALGGCSFGENGIAPPTDRIFLPAGIALDPAADLVYVVNSNSDLRFNAGTVVAVDLARAKLVRDCATDQTPAACQSDPALQSPRPLCTKTRFSRTEPVPGNYCCVDMDDSNILDCNEPQFIQDGATIQIGSFGGAVALQGIYDNAGGSPVLVRRRLFIAVRAEPSITWADVTVDGSNNATMRCTGTPDETAPPPKNAFCDDNWRIRRPGGATPEALALPEEPHVLWFDEPHGALFVGHLSVTANGQLQGGGLSTLDVCNPLHGKPVAFAGLTHTTFLPATLSQDVAALSDRDPSQPDTVLYATARFSAAISGMVFRNSDAAGCNQDDPAPSPEPRDLTLLPAEYFFSPAFLPNGSDVRGILFSDDEHGSRAFVLHRNDSTAPANPAAIAVLDRRRLADGTPANDPIGLIQVCNGPSNLQWHDAGRGKRIFVTCYDNGRIYVVDPVAMLVTAIIEAGVAPTSLVFSPRDSGIAYVASFFNSHLSLIDLRPGSPTENRVILRIGLPHGYGE